MINLYLIKTSPSSPPFTAPLQHGRPCVLKSKLLTWKVWWQPNVYKSLWCPGRDAGMCSVMSALFVLCCSLLCLNTDMAAVGESLRQEFCVSCFANFLAPMTPSQGNSGLTDENWSWPCSFFSPPMIFCCSLLYPYVSANVAKGLMGDVCVRACRKRKSKIHREKSNRNHILGISKGDRC